MNTVRELKHIVIDLIDDMTAQYPGQTPPCEILHFELGLPQTPKPDADRIRRELAEHPKAPIELDEDSVKLTIEHDELHLALRRFVLESMADGSDSTQLAAQMLSVGRRMGLREAAELMGT